VCTVSGTHTGHPTISPDQAAGSDAGQRRCQTVSDRQDAIFVLMVQVRVLAVAQDLDQQVCGSS
jgi:hypothetical protein